MRKAVVNIFDADRERHQQSAVPLAGSSYGSDDRTLMAWTGWRVAGCFIASLDWPNVLVIGSRWRRTRPPGGVGRHRDKRVLYASL
jgi:hypothetical protein